MEKKILFFIFVFVIIHSNILLAGLKPTDSGGQYPENAQAVHIGVYLMNIYNIDQASNSFFADFYLWCKWKGVINPIENLEFVNYVDKWGFTKEEIYDTIQVLEDGFNYNVLRVEGRFYHQFTLEDFPFDSQSLDIQIENSKFTEDSLIFISSVEQSSFRPELDVSGWKIDSFILSSYTDTYETNFGMPGKENEKYSNVTVKLNISRPVSFFAWKLLLPLLIILISSLGTMFISPTFVDARISLPIGSLLAAVFLQQSYSSILPEITYMVLMDKIYVLSYLMIISNLAHAIITANIVSKKGENYILKVKKLDMKFIPVSVVAFLILSLLISLIP